LLALRRAGCSVPENVRTMEDVVTENALPGMCAWCLRGLESLGCGGDSIPSPTKAFPTRAFARVRACADLAAQLTALARSAGCADPDEWAFTDFLVPSEKSARDACTFLLELAYEIRYSSEDSALDLDAADARVKEHARLPGRGMDAPWEDIPSRRAVLRRVGEFVKNIKKQELETEKILQNARGIKKSIETARETLARSRALVDAPLYRAALEGDAMSKETFKHFTSIDANFERLAEDLLESHRVESDRLKMHFELEKEKKKLDVANDVNARLEEYLVLLNKEIEETTRT